ncbi:MAG: cellulose biosynthesis cyclic di-GMP-binding regulatory protein BcsB, partial [Mariprofundaceae bacterium]
MFLYKFMVHFVKRALLLPVCLLLVTPLALADIGDRIEVAVSKAELYAGPSSSATQLMSLAANEQMVELERQGEWVFVSLKRSGDQGWIHAVSVQASTANVKRVRHSNRSKQMVEKKHKRKVSRSKRQNRSKYKSIEVADPVVKNPESAFASRKMSLADLGLRKGVMFEGAAGGHQTSLFFPAPMDSHITNGTLRLLFRASPNLHDMANIRVSINDIPYRQLALLKDGGMHEMDLMLPASAFEGKVVKVTVNVALPVSDDRCFDDRMSNVFLHIMPETALTISYQPLEKSIRDAWRLLPLKVTISLPEGKISKEQFASTLAVMALLADRGKEVELVRLPAVGDIVVASRATIGGLSGSTIGLDHSSNLALTRFPDRTSIVLMDPYDVQPMYLLDDNWRILGAGDHYRVYRPDSLHAYGNLVGTGEKADHFSLPLATLGMNTDVQYITREASWSTVISPYALPQGMVPDFLNLDIVAPIHWKDDPSYELYVFLNDVLVKSARLDDSGLKQHFTVNLPAEYQKQFNDIRVVVQHDIESGNCKGIMSNDLIQISPGSALVVKKGEDIAPKKFSDLSRYFLPGFDTYVEDSYLSHPVQVLHLMARLAADFPLLIDSNRLYFVSPSDLLNPKEPFVSVGHIAMDTSINAPVRFDKGHVRILTAKGQSYFDVGKLNKVTIAEIVEAPAAYGLWISPSDNADEKITRRLNLAEDNVAFIDSHGVIKTMNSAEPSLAQVYYPDAKDWFDVLGKYKFWLMIGLWFLLTMVVVYLYRMSK